MTSEVVRNVIMLQCMFIASIGYELFLYKHTYNVQKPTGDQQHMPSQISMSDLQIGHLPKFKLGIIGCGQVGTSFLTKLLEVRE